MNSLTVLILSLSLSASVIAVILFACRPLYRDRLSKSWQYYIWLVVLLRLLIPFAPEANLMGFLFGTIAAPQQLSVQPEPQTLQPAGIMAPLEGLGDINGQMDADPSMVTPVPQGNNGTSQPAPSQDAEPVFWTQLLNSLWLIWFVPALILLVRSMTNYNSFVRYILAGKEEIRDEVLLTAYQRACEDVGIRKVLPIYENQLASSPMLVGLFRPCIILPALDLDADSMQMVLRHELIHHKRRDLLYKWLLQLAVCIHWFNPLVYLVRKEVGRACELSCDERVIAPMPVGEKRGYGDVLLASIKAGGNYSSLVASVTLSEDGKDVKERLHSILNFHPGSRGTKVIAVVCSLLLLFGACFSGAYVGFSAAARGSQPQPYSSRNYSDLGDSIGERIAGRILENLDQYPWEDYVDQVSDWAINWAEDWTDSWLDTYDDAYWDAWADRFESLWTEKWENSYKSLWNGESWKYLDYIYGDGYFVGLGVSLTGSLEDYARVDTINLGGTAYTIAFPTGYESYGDEPRVVSMVRDMLSDISGLKWQEDVRNAPYYVVRSVHDSADPAELLRQFYNNRSFVEFVCLVDECEGLDVIEELLYRAADDRESIYFILLSDLLPRGFTGGEALARTAEEYEDIVMLEAMSDFIPGSLYDSLMEQILKLPFSLG